MAQSTGEWMPDYRRLDLDDARAKANAVAESLQLTPTFEHRSANGLVVTLCGLVEDDRVAAVGMGKGQGQRAEVGALFEALERLVMARASGAHDRQLIADVVTQAGLRTPDLVHRVAATHPDARCLVRHYEGPGTAVAYPAGLLNPFVGEREAVEAIWAKDYLRYSSSVGTAAGTDRAEATLHGLLELIEHDAVSLALLGWFVANGSPVRLVNPRTTPRDVESRRMALQSRTGRDVLLIDVTTDLGIPAFMAVMDAVADGAGVAGGGASISPVGAACSALDEVEQLWAFHGGETDEIPSAALADWPPLFQCHRLAVDDLRERGALTTWPTGDDPSTGDVDRALDHIVTLLRTSGISCFTSLLSDPAQDGLAVVSCLAPGLERFSIVRHGHPVVPTGRGREIWERATQKR